MRACVCGCEGGGTAGSRRLHVCAHVNAQSAPCYVWGEGAEAACMLPLPPHEGERLWAQRAWADAAGFALLCRLLVFGMRPCLCCRSGTCRREGRPPQRPPAKAALQATTARGAAMRGGRQVSCTSTAIPTSAAGRHRRRRHCRRCQVRHAGRLALVVQSRRAVHMYTAKEDWDGTTSGCAAPTRHLVQQDSAFTSACCLGLSPAPSLPAGAVPNLRLSDPASRDGGGATAGREWLHGVAPLGAPRSDLRYLDTLWPLVGGWGGRARAGASRNACMHTRIRHACVRHQYPVP